MANLFITEFSEVMKAAGGSPLQIGKNPSVAVQKITYTTENESSPFKDSTIFVRLVADADAYIEFGTSPSATSSSIYLPSKTVEYFGIDLEAAPKLSVYDGSS